MKTTKEVAIIARYAHKTNGKLNGTVSYLIRSSNGKDTYCTTLIEGKASGCSCPAKAGCYHKKQLSCKEQERKQVASQFNAKHAPIWLVELVAKGVIVAPKQVVEKASQPANIIDIGSRGNLNGNKGYSLLRA